MGSRTLVMAGVRRQSGFPKACVHGQAKPCSNATAHRELANASQASLPGFVMFAMFAQHEHREKANKA
ncbi:hypothetical protein [Delftia tsuruhatensis]|jgi:hypothetical protein|uniref:hypothetical protein n=1 Tax=Delftia tsuruhatensis TaxID=180282 RepID=UPI0028A72C7F|nr:hypothetical protein [Delftia tsuruhatensis]